MFRYLQASVVLGAWAALALVAAPALAQKGRPGPGGPVVVGAPPPGAAPAPEAKPGDAKPGEGDKPAAEENKPKPVETVKRPTEAQAPADRSELSVRPDDDGKISFSFKGQPWPFVLEWLADISDKSLQWEEAPAGYLDLTTRGRYTVEEVQDLINSVLLSKGFTLLENGDVLIVANLKTLDTSLVPRVSIAELDRRGDHELVKTFIDLDWLVAENAAEEIKPMLSPYGKVAALKTTNRLDVLETAGNLRRVVEMIDEEQSDNGQQRLVREFRLKHTRAAEVLETLQKLLGIEQKSSAPLDPRQAMMQQQQMMMAQQGQPGQMPQAPAKKEPQVFLVVNSRENSILANAPPDKMAVIEQAVLVVDVPQDSEQGLLANIHKMQVYRLAGITPEALVKVLQELGSLDPTSRLEIDQKNRAIIAFAPLADHVLIRSLVDKLDGAGRRFEVIQLRVLSAEYVAGSINTLMNGPEKTDNNRNRFPYYYYFDGGGSQQQQDAADRFQIEADIEHNRLLLRANDIELAEVKTLLMKLGEIPPEGRNTHTTRVIPTAPGEETEKLLERLKRVWPSVAPNPLDVEAGALEGDESGENSKRQERAKSRGKRPASKTQPKLQSTPKSGAPREQETRREPPRIESPAGEPRLAASPRFRLAQDRQAAQPDDSDAESPPVGQPFQADETDEQAVGQPFQADKTDEKSPDAGQPVQADDRQAGKPDLQDEPEESQPGKADLRDDADENQAAEPEVPPALAPRAPGKELPRAAHAPVKITVGPYGLVISSADTEALDRIEDLMVDIMPPRLSYKVFTLHHTYAKDVAELLEDIYKNDADGNSKKTDMFESFWYGYRPQTNQKTRSTLSSRRPLTFVPDPVTNTILVQGADANQLAEIESLIEIYDQRETPDSNSVRHTKIVALRYAKAGEVSEIVKDVFRDLLSPNDKALQQNMPQQPQQQQQQRNGGYYDALFSYLTEDNEKAQNVPRFKGMLSVGIDARSNSLAISAPQILLDDVLEMVDKLDLAAKPTRPVVRIRRLSQPGAVAQIQQAFGAKQAEAKPASTEQPETANNNAENQQSGGMGNRRRNGGGAARN